MKGLFSKNLGVRLNSCKCLTKNTQASPQRTLGVRLSWDDGKLVSIGIEGLEQKRRVLTAGQLDAHETPRV